MNTGLGKILTLPVVQMRPRRALGKQCSLAATFAGMPCCFGEHCEFMRLCSFQFAIFIGILLLQAALLRTFMGSSSAGRQAPTVSALQLLLVFVAQQMRCFVRVLPTSRVCRSHHLCSVGGFITLPRPHTTALHP